jgi:hypothetical protein
MKGLLEEVVDSGFQDSKCILILVLDDLVVILFILLILGLLILGSLIEHVFSLFLDLQDLLGGF